MPPSKLFRQLARAGDQTALQSRLQTGGPGFYPLVGIGCTQRRTLLTKRFKHTSFYAPSYTPSHPTPSSVVPNSAEAEDVSKSEDVIAESSATAAARASAASTATGTGAEQGISKKRERKQRYLDSLMDKAGELSLRCSILDAEGNWTAEEGRYKKSELCKEYDLDPRDLRKLDSLSPNLVPLILTRKKCILISMLHIRALIKPDRVIVFDTAGTVESEVSKRFKWHLERNIKYGLKDPEEVEDDVTGLVYEHRALESILVATANALEEEMGYTRQLVQQLLADLEGDINRDNLKRLLHYSRRMVGFQSRARYVKRAADEVLESDEDLSAMYLTSRAKGHPRALHDHEQLELLFESFTKQVEEIVSEVDTLVANMNSTQEIAELMLDSGRNALLALDVKISIATLGIGTGALVAGIFGMNLNTQIESHPYAFYFVSGTASFIAFVIMAYGMRSMRRIRRIALSDSGSSFDRLMSHPAWEQHAVTSTEPHEIQRQNTALWRRLIHRRMRVAGLLWGRRRGAEDGLSWNDRCEPVWINKKADMARARDALRYQEIAAKEAEKRRKEANKAFGKWNDHHEPWDRWGSDFKWGGKDRQRWAKHHYLNE